jgi:hypothetical protein
MCLVEGAFVLRTDAVRFAMIASFAGAETLQSNVRAGRYCIRLHVSPAAREDAWELFRLVAQCGGVEVSDRCFALPDEERWLTAAEMLQFRFGHEFFDIFES